MQADGCLSIVIFVKTCHDILMGAGHTNNGVDSGGAGSNDGD